MARYDRLGGLKREFHHLKIADETTQKPKYERAMMIYKPALMGRSCYIMGSNGWMYIDPKDNQDVAEYDWREFETLKKDVLRSALFYPNQDFSMEVEALHIASLLNHQTGIMRLTAYNLIKYCQVLDITVDGPALCQLLMFIQDGLSELQKMGLPEPETVKEVGEADMKFSRGDDVKTWTEPVVVREAEIKTGVAGI